MTLTTFTIKENQGIHRRSEPVTFGLPFPQGKLHEVRLLELSNENNELIPIQVTPLAFWLDKSVKWLLLDFQVSIPPNDECRYLIKKGNTFFELPEGIEIKKEEKKWIIDTKTALFHMDTKKLIPFAKVVFSGQSIVSEEGSGITLLNGKGRKYEPKIRSMTVESYGKLRSCIRIDGNFQNGDNMFCQFISRIHFFANSGLVKIEFCIKNPLPARHKKGLWDLGDKGSVYLKDLTMGFGLKTSSGMTVNWTDQFSKSMQQEDFDSNVLLYQGSSGGKNWLSSNHNNRLGKITNTLKGYEVRRNGVKLKAGCRANPLIFVGNSDMGVSGAIYQFWQNFPSALEVKNHCLKISLFPVYCNELYELQGGEQKTHTVFLNFSPDSNSLNWVQSPLLPTVEPDWYVRSKAIPYLVSNEMAQSHLYEILVEVAVEGSKTFFDRKEVIDEYGWRNFGDLYADHESVNHSNSSPLVSHYNNQYDLIYGFMRRYLKTGRRHWYELMNDLAHHVIDIDIYHTSRDREEYNGGMFWHTDHFMDACVSTHRSFSKEHLKYKNPSFCGGGPSLEHVYTTGLLYHYYLTGDNASRDALVEICDWVSRNVDRCPSLIGTIYEYKRNFPILIRLVKGEKIRSDKYPFNRGTGNSINSLLDVCSLNGEKTYLRKIEEIIKNTVHPRDNINSRNILEAELNWSYTVFLISLGRYLDYKSEISEFDEMFFYGRRSLLNYASWMLINEYPYLEKPEILEYPNETWSAADIKKSQVFCYAARYGTHDQRALFLKKAEFFFNHSIQEMKTFEGKDLTRPVALLLQNGDMYSSFNDYNDIPIKDLELEKKYDWGRHYEFFSVSSFLKKNGSSSIKAMQNTSLRSEVKWLKCRLGMHA